jgi:hypothetical protein
MRTRSYLAVYYSTHPPDPATVSAAGFDRDTRTLLSA